MPSVVNRHSKRITSVCSLLRPHLWPYSDASSCLIARRSVAFLPPWISECGSAAQRVLAGRARSPRTRGERGGLWDRQGNRWIVFDLDGTRQAARQRALPQGPDLPPPQRRLSAVCTPGYRGRKRGEVVRTRTTLLQAHTHQW